MYGTGGQEEVAFSGRGPLGMFEISWEKEIAEKRSLQERGSEEIIAEGRSFGKTRKNELLRLHAKKERKKVLLEVMPRPSGASSSMVLYLDVL